MSRLALPAVAFFASVCCTPTATSAPSSVPAPPTHVTIAEPPPPPRTAEQERAVALQDKLSGALAYVSAIRGLSIQSPVQGRLIGRAEISRYITQQLEEEAPQDLVEATEALLYGFGTVDAAFDYRKTVIGLMTTQLLGFYDPKQKAFFVGGDLTGKEADATLWHELVHALQDQHYDLSRLTQWQPDQGDSLAAVHALAEGDAMSVMLDAMLKPQGATALEVPEGLMRAESVLGSAALTAPPVLVRSLVAPYVDGLAFTNHLRRHGGFAAVDQAWRSPPVSTEQLLHPEKYLAHEAPQVISLPPPPPHSAELKERYHDVMGEQTLRLLLEEWLPARTAAAAASDWGGDRVAVFSDEDRKRWAVGWHVRFDSVAAAERALSAFARAAPLTERGSSPRLGEAALELAPKAGFKGDKLCRPRHSQGPLALLRRGPDLAIALGPFERDGLPAQSPDCAAALAWAAKIAAS